MIQGRKLKNRGARTQALGWALARRIAGEMLFPRQFQESSSSQKGCLWVLGTLGKEGIFELVDFDYEANTRERGKKKKKENKPPKQLNFLLNFLGHGGTYMPVIPPLRRPWLVN
jgi:hypothetical protein